MTKMSLQLKECGKIFLSTDLRLCAIDCFYCRELFTQWEQFLDHVKTSHYDKVLETDSNEVGVANQGNDQVAIESPTHELELDNQTDKSPIDGEEENECFDVEFVIAEDDCEINSDKTCTESIEKTGNNVQLSNVESSTSLASNSRSRSILTFETAKETVMISFIESLRSFECLWNVDSIDYKKKSACQSALRVLSDMYNLEVVAIQKTINYIRNWYKQRRRASNDKSEQTSQYIKLCEFLCPRLKRGTFKCPFCTKTFSLKKYLDVHKQRHLIELPFQCLLCPKRAATSTEIAVHLRVHTNERPYTCRYCSETFKTSSSLCVHERKHTEPTIQCSLCPKAFYTNYQLKNHINIHLNVRNYKCNACGKTFTTAKALYSHNSNVHIKKDKGKGGMEIG